MLKSGQLPAVMFPHNAATRLTGWMAIICQLIKLQPKLICLLEYVTTLYQFFVQTSKKLEQSLTHKIGLKGGEQNVGGWGESPSDSPILKYSTESAHSRSVDNSDVVMGPACSILNQFHQVHTFITCMSKNNFYVIHICKPRFAPAFVHTFKLSCEMLRIVMQHLSP